MTDEIKSKLPFISEGTLIADEEVTLYVKDDPVHGLQAPAGTGYIVNDGPGSISVQCIDNLDGLSDISTVNINEQLLFEESDDVEVCALTVVADALGASYRARFARNRL